MKTGIQFDAIIFLATIAVTLCLKERLHAQDLPGLAETNIIHFHESISTRFRAGDTNVPLLRMDSFKGGRHSCSVSKTGKVTTAYSNGVSNSTDWNRPMLSETNLALLISTMEKLPKPATESVPLYSQLHITGIRNNECFHFVYDIESPPHEVRQLYRITGATFAAP